MRSNNLMLQSAMNRLQFWQEELVKAEKSGQGARIQECANFIKEYGVLINEMAVNIARSGDVTS
jgi:hypothetical protein